MIEYSNYIFLGAELDGEVLGVAYVDSE